MAIVQHPIDGSSVGVSSTISVTKTGAMELTVSAGSWTEPDENGAPIVYTLASPEVLTYTADPTDPKEVIIGLIHEAGGSPETDIWSDEIVLDAPLMKDVTSAHAPPPGNYEHIVKLSWFQIPAAETDLDNTTIDVIQVT